jgi:hypothetical protein
VIWFAPFQGVGDDDDLIVRFTRPLNPAPPEQSSPPDEEYRVKAL